MRYRSSYTPRTRYPYRRKTWTPRRQSRTALVTRNQPLVTTTNTSSFQTGQRRLNSISIGRFSNLPTLWPDKMLVKMKYIDTVNTYINQATFSTGSCINIGYRVNSLYDPLLSTASSQPIAGFNEFAVMYQRYRVHACKATVDLINQINMTAIPLVASWTYATQAVPPANYSNMIATFGNPYTVWGTASPLGSVSPLHLESYVSMKKLLGSKSADNDNDYSSLVTGNPVNTLYGYLSVGCPTPTASITLTAGLILQLEFWAEFYQRDYEYN